MRAFFSGAYFGMRGRGAVSRDALEGKAPQRQPQRRLGRRLEEVAEVVGGGRCRLQMPLRPALAVRGTVAGHRLGPWRGGGGEYLPPFPCIPGCGAVRPLVPPCNPILERARRTTPGRPSAIQRRLWRCTNPSAVRFSITRDVAWVMLRFAGSDQQHPGRPTASVGVLCSRAV